MMSKTKENLELIYAYSTDIAFLWDAYLMLYDKAPIIFPPNHKIYWNKEPLAEKQSRILGELAVMTTVVPDIAVMPTGITLKLYHKNLIGELKTLFGCQIRKIPSHMVVMFIRYITLHELCHYLRLYRNIHPIYADSKDDSTPWKQCIDNAEDYTYNHYGDIRDEEETDNEAVEILKSVYGLYYGTELVLNDGFEYLAPIRGGRYFKWKCSRSESYTILQLCLEFIELYNRRTTVELTEDEYRDVVGKMRTLAEVMKAWQKKRSSKYKIKFVDISEDTDEGEDSNETSESV